MLFKDRIDAGRRLAEALERYRGQDAVVYALPRGGVVVGFEVATRLNVPLDLVVVRKIGHPLEPEYGIAAIAEDGHMVANLDEVERIDRGWFRQEAERMRREAQRRREYYLAGRQPVSPKGKTAILVDDGIATGLTFKAAIQEIKHRQPERIVAAVPVSPWETAEEIRLEVNELVSLFVPEVFLGAIGAYYEDFRQVTDETVKDLLRSAGEVLRHGEQAA